MAKEIKYQIIAAEINHGTADNTDIEQILSNKKMICNTQAAYDTNYPIAEKEAVPGTIEISGEFDPEPEAPSGDESSVWDELDAAYQEGVDSV